MTYRDITLVTRSKCLSTMHFTRRASWIFSLGSGHYYLALQIQINIVWKLQKLLSELHIHGSMEFYNIKFFKYMVQMQFCAFNKVVIPLYQAIQLYKNSAIDYSYHVFGIPISIITYNGS
ncbi:hypothetical protein ACJX0J_016331, partial [Zea mays]